MKRIYGILLLTTLLSFTFSDFAFAKDPIDSAMEELDIQKGDPNLCVLTNATYVMLNGETTEKYVDIITEKTGCSIGQGNLLFFHRQVDYLMKVALFRKDTKDAVVLTYRGSETNTVSVNIDGNAATNPEKWKELEDALGRKDAFSIVTITNSWAKGCPYDLLKICEFHNHLCPGIITGYHLAYYILKDYPAKKGETYIWIASPAWCKDDAIQILFDLTPGKRSLYAKEQPGELFAKKVPYAGILIIWKNKEKKGRGVVFQYDWGKVAEISGLDLSEFKPEGFKNNPTFFTTRLKCNWALLENLDKPEEFVRVFEEFDVTPELYAKLISSGVNPYVELGLMERPEHGEVPPAETVPPVPAWVYIVILILALTAVCSIVYAVKVKKA